MDGRILAWLFICEPPHQSFSDLVNILQASKSSISTSTRQLIRAGWIERVRFSGKRRDYYRLRPEFCSSSVTYFIAKMEGLQKLTEKGMDLLEGSPPARFARLAEAHDIFLYMKEEMPKLLENWERRFHTRAESG